MIKSLNIISKMNATTTRFIWFYTLIAISIIEIFLIFLTINSNRKNIKSKDIVAGNANYWTSMVKKKLERLRIENEKFEKSQRGTIIGSEETSVGLKGRRYGQSDE